MDTVAAIQELVDKQAITEVLTHYCRALDRLDSDLLASVFSEDAQLDYGEALYRGPAGPFLPFALEFQGAMQTTQHRLSNVLIALDGERARAESYVDAYHIQQRDGQQVELVVGARYLDNLERGGDGVWRIVKRTEVIDWGREHILENDWLATNPGLNRGSHDTSDPSCSLLN
ncbi:MAG: nuclear transport factor 2 family protein [Halioglobus sp.]|nr:nuclear transport factor 2 family protein [Halioglobus sp.]